jgi:hypothetical protein
MHYQRRHSQGGTDREIESRAPPRRPACPCGLPQIEQFIAKKTALAYW